VKPFTAIISVFMLTFISAQEMIAVLYPTANGDNLGKSAYISETRSAYSAGEFRGELSFGSHTVISNSNQTVFFTKLNPQGSYEWLNTIRGTRNVFASKILEKGNQVIVAGDYSDSVFIGTDTLVNIGQKGIYIAIYDTLGAYQYSLNPDCMSCASSDIMINDNNELIVTGKYYNGFNFAGQNYDSPLGTNLFLLSYDLSNQNENWFQYSTGSNTISSKVRLDSNNDIIVVGSYGQGVTIGATVMFDNGTEHNTFIAKYNSSGAFLWAEGIIGLSQVHGLGLAIGENDDIFISGELEMSISLPDGNTLNTQGLMDGFVYKMNSSGDYQWAKQIGGIDDDPAIDIVIDLNGNPIVLLNSGRNTTFETITMDPNGFNEPLIVKLNKFDGSHIWHKRIPSFNPSGVVLSSAIAIQDSIICVTGANYTGIEFNSTVIGSSNLFDYFLAVLIDHDYEEYPIDNASIKGINNNLFSIYPNPFNSELTISSEQEIKCIEIYTMDGKLVYALTLNENHSTISPDLNSGSFILKIFTDNNISTTKITHL